MYRRGGGRGREDGEVVNKLDWMYSRCLEGPI